MTGKASLYWEVYQALRKKILSGEYEIGEQLPTESELQSTFNVSRITIRKAIEMLAADGYVLTKQGRGTEVLDPKTTQKLNYISSFSETLIERGYRVSLKDVRVSIIEPSSRVNAELKLKPGEKVVRIYRVRMANDKPIAIMTNYIPEKYLPGIEGKMDELESLYHLLETEYHVNLETAIESIGACAAGATEADILDVPVGYPLLTSRRITFADRRPFEVVVSSIVADKYEYKVFLKGRPE